MTPTTLLWTILVPAIAAVLVALVPKGVKLVRELIALAAAGVSLYLGFALFAVKNLEWRLPWLGGGVDFELRLFHFSSFILLGLAGFLILIALYSTVKMKDHPMSGSTISMCSSRPPWPTARSWPTISSPCSSSGKASWSRSMA